MGRISMAWQVLVNGVFAAKVTKLLETPTTIAAPVQPVAPPKLVAPMRPLRSDAVTLLAAFQREGRLIDFLKEPIETYSDAQVGAAVRDIHRDCSGMLERQFALRPVLDQAEGSNVTIGANAKNGRI